ncbi:MAG TPA: hypothetical protein PKH79_10885, partial [Prolixibacteraceae bacterium]|nr:hypothetical protein [Prolixibacteraceae bacterium]
MSLFRKSKSAAVIEKERLQLSRDYQVYTEVESSKKLKDFLALEEKVESTPFKVRRKEIESLRYKGSAEEKLVKQFARLEKNPKLVNYFKTASSSDLKRFLTIKGKGLPEQVEELEAYMKSGKYDNELKNFNHKKKTDQSFAGKWESTEAYKKEKEFQELKNSDDYIFYQRFAKSTEYKNFLAVDCSSELSQYWDLQKEVNSDKFKEKKAYLENPDRYKTTVDYKALCSYEELLKDEGIQLYFKYNETD